MAIFRSIGMKISDYKIPGYARASFNAVLIGGAKEDLFLKTLENESHTDISSKGIRDNKMKKRANKFLSNLKKELGKIIDKKIQDLHPADGRIDTSDLIFESEIDIKNNLSNNIEKIDLVGSGIYKKKVKERRDRRNPAEYPISNSKNTIEKKRTPRKIKPNDNKQNINEAILAPNDIVNRIVFEEYEILQFNLTDIDEVPSQGKLNIVFRIVDGDGKEYNGEFNLRKAYYKIINNLTKDSYDYDENGIYNVIVRDGQVKIKLLKRNNLTDITKIIYQLEVIS